MSKTIQFGKDFDAFHHAIETDRFFFYKLNKEVFNRSVSGPMEVECFFEGNFSNAYEIQKVIRHVVGVQAIIKDKIDDNGYLRYIDIEFKEEIPDIHIVADLCSELTESEFFELDENLYSECGMNWVFTIVLDAIYSMFEVQKLVKDETFTYNCSEFNLWHAENAHITMSRDELRDECKRLAKTHIRKYLSERERYWLIHNVLRYHPEWKRWEDQGVKEIYADYNREQYNTLGFQIVFNNGEKSNISYIKSIKNI